MVPVWLQCPQRRFQRKHRSAAWRSAPYIAFDHRRQPVAGVFQTLENPALPGGARPIGPGATINFTGWHQAVGTTNQTSEIKIEWTGAPQNRFDILNVPVGQYSQFSHSGVAPAGTTGTTITYAISTFGPGQNTTALVYVDDFVVTVIPEPATMGGMALGLVGLLRLRRRK